MSLTKHRPSFRPAACTSLRFALLACPLQFLYNNRCQESCDGTGLIEYNAGNCESAVGSSYSCVRCLAPMLHRCRTPPLAPSHEDTALALQAARRLTMARSFTASSLQTAESAANRSPARTSSI